MFSGPGGWSAAAAAAEASTHRSSSQAAYSRSRVAGRPCGHSCQELPRAGNLCFLTRVSEGTLALWIIIIAGHHSVPQCHGVFLSGRCICFKGNMLAKSTAAGGGACSRSSSSSSRKQRSRNNRSSSRAAYSRSRAAGRPCGHSCQELPRAGNLCFWTRVSEGTLGLVDYHCRAPFRPSVPWCFPVREVRFLRQFVG